MKTIEDIAEHHAHEMFQAIVRQGLRSELAVLGCVSDLSQDEKTLLEADELLHHECFVDAVAQAYEFYGYTKPFCTPTWVAIEMLPGGENEN